MKVLIIEDDTQLNIALCEFFKIKVFQTVSAKNGLQAMYHIDSEYFDLYIIDINIPDINGLDLLKYIRKVDKHTPIIIITASVEIQNFSTAFKYGCSEYIKKPFHLKELDIRVGRLLSLEQDEMIHVNDEITYNTYTEAFFYRDQPVYLRNKEKRFCVLLMRNLNMVVPSEMIYRYVWEGEVKASYPLRQLLGELRKKLPNIIQTKFKEGYIIEAQK